jgi:hypothetical protein
MLEMMLYHPARGSSPLVRWSRFGNIAWLYLRTLLVVATDGSRVKFKAPTDVLWKFTS